ncbi:MAG: ExbD/TolR family protein, partial [Thermoguttaceae bacterium]
MRIKSTAQERLLDMTPMIDICFLLIAFFVFLINFSEAEQDQRIKLPKSELAVPARVPPAQPLTLQIMDSGIILFNSKEYGPADIVSALSFERRLLDIKKIDPKTVTILVRGDKNCEA